MAFVKFKNPGKSYTPKVSINHRGMMGFNQGAARRFNLNSYRFCVMYYNAEESQIKIEFVNDENAEGAIRLRNRPIGSDIGAKAFLTYFDILPKGTFMYEVMAAPGEDAVIIDLKSARERKESRTFSASTSADGPFSEEDEIPF